MNTERIDVLAVMDANPEILWLTERKRDEGLVPFEQKRLDDLLKARAAVAELIEAATYATCSACQHNRCEKLRGALRGVANV